MAEATKGTIKNRQLDNTEYLRKPAKFIGLDVMNEELVERHFEDLSIPQSKIIGGAGGLMPLVDPATADFLVKQSPAGDGTLVDAGFPLEGRRSDVLEWAAETQGPVPGTSLDSAFYVAIQGNIAAITLAARDGLAIVDISDPANPTWLGDTLGPVPGTSLNGASGVAIYGNHAVVACIGNASLAIVDISDPTSPTWIAETRGPTPGTSLNGVYGVAIYDHYAVVVCQLRDSLAIVDISDPANPTWIAETRGPTPGTSLDGALGVAIYGRYAVVASAIRSALSIIDIGDPANPTWIAETRGPTPGVSMFGATYVALSGGIAYVVSSFRENLAAIDISDPTNPTWLSETQGPTPGVSIGRPYSVAVTGDYAYVACQNSNALIVVDISDPSDLTWLGETQGPTPGTSLDRATGVAVYGNYAVVTANSSDRVAIINIGGFALPSIEVGSIGVDNLDVKRGMTVAGRISTPSGISAGSLNADRGVGGAYVREHRVVDTVGTDYDIDSLLAGLWVLTLEGNHAIDTLNLLPGRSVFLHIIQGTVGGHTPTLTAVDWGDDGVPVWSAGVGDRDVIELFTHDGMTISGRLVGQY